MRHICGSAPVPVAVVVAICAGVLLVACGTSQQPTPGSEHATRVDALLPTSEPLAPAAPASAVAPATDSPAAPTDTPVPATNTPAPPTYTPRPLPTYTPRPIPLPSGEGERGDATPFQAQTLDGAELVLTDTFGTPTLLAFWAPW